MPPLHPTINHELQKFQFSTKVILFCGKINLKFDCKELVFLLVMFSVPPTLPSLELRYSGPAAPLLSPHSYAPHFQDRIRVPIKAGFFRISVSF